jgi:hypothetical protein
MADDLTALAEGKLEEITDAFRTGIRDGESGR